MASPKGDNGEIERSRSKSPDSLMEDDKFSHLEKISDWKTYCKVRHFSMLTRKEICFVFQGLMDIALLSANANQLRHAMELSAPYQHLLIVLFSAYLCLLTFLLLFTVFRIF